MTSSIWEKEKYATKRFQACDGCIDCKSIIRENCPAEEKCHHHNPKDSRTATKVAKGWCHVDLYICECFVGRAGTINDLSDVSVLLLTQDIVCGAYDFWKDDEHQIHDGGVVGTRLYFLGDDIYYKWLLFAKPIQNSTNALEQRYAKGQETLCMDVEQYFEVLQKAGLRFFGEKSAGGTTTKSARLAKHASFYKILLLL